MNNKVTKFTDDTKLLRVIKIAADCEEVEDSEKKRLNITVNLVCPI